MLDRPPVQEALDAAARREPLPEPWPDRRAAYDALHVRPLEWDSVIGRLSPVSPVKGRQVRTV